MEVSISASVTDAGAFIMGFSSMDPSKGNGRRAYEKWERELPKTVRVVGLQATATSYGFWVKMGFSFMYEPRDNLFTMVKGVNGYPTPPMVRVSHNFRCV
jgi:hypothetical protein